MTRAALTPVPCARRTEPSAWLVPPPGKRRMPDGVDLRHTDVAARLPGSTEALPGANVAPLFPPPHRSRPCA